jgi:glucokinase
MEKSPGQKDALFVGVDIGGTKIQATLATAAGEVIKTKRVETPREGGSEQVLEAIDQVIGALLETKKASAQGIQGIGVGVPGVTDFKRGEVIVTPNMKLGRFALGPYLQEKFQVPVVVENDCNLGTLGECWIGAARGARSAFGIFVGTGIGGGFVRKRRLWRGARKAAGEVGHIVMVPNGPLCGCGNRGCLEAVASRSAIERQIREALQAGRSSVIAQWLTDGAQVIRSKMLRNALDAGDDLIRDILRQAAEFLGYACLTVRHLFDPGVLVLGGGVIEACGDYILPIVREIVLADKLPGAGPGGEVVASQLGDDAVVLGAVALVAQKTGFQPFRRARSTRPIYPVIEVPSFGVVRTPKKTYSTDIYILADGRIQRRKKKRLAKFGASGHLVSLREMQYLCEGNPEVVFVGVGHSSQVILGPGVEEFLRASGISYHLVETSHLPEAFNSCTQRKAAIIHVTC